MPAPSGSAQRNSFSARCHNALSAVFQSCRLEGESWVALRWILCVCLCLLIPTRARAQAGGQPFVSSDTLSIRFRADSTRIDLSYDGNGARWMKFENNFRKNFSHLNPASLRLDIFSGASPEGSAAHNRWLGENRGQAIRRLVRQRLGQGIGIIEVHNEGARWFDLYDRVAASNEPWRDEVLRIIELPASSNEKERDHREQKLRNLQGGKVWPVLLERYLAPLRSGASATLTWQGSRDTIVVREVIVTHDTVVVMNTPVFYTVAGSDSARSVAMSSQHTQPLVDENKQRYDSIQTELRKYPAWALKTNLLLWGVVAPNIQLELPLGNNNRWSIELEYFITWFTWSQNAHASQFHNLGAEVRYWLGNRSRRRWLEGWHIGLAAAVGYYDWEWKRSDGYQGEYINSYLNVGYQHRWGKHWAMDFGLGVGAMFTKYRHYYGSSVYPKGREEQSDNYLIWHESGHLVWPGACHVNVSLAYMFNAWPFRTKSRKLRAYR